jgi:hypothetical protein
MGRGAILSEVSYKRLADLPVNIACRAGHWAFTVRNPIYGADRDINSFSFGRPIDNVKDVCVKEVGEPFPQIVLWSDYVFIHLLRDPFV